MTFYRENTIKALRKPRLCEGCGRAMAVGEPALYCTGTSTESDGFWHAHYHAECRAAEIALNGQYGNGFKWYLLSDFDREDMEFVRVSHPVAYAYRYPASKSHEADRAFKEAGL